MPAYQIDQNARTSTGVADKFELPCRALQPTLCSRAALTTAHVPHMRALHNMQSTTMVQSPALGVCRGVLVPSWCSACNTSRLLYLAIHKM